MFRVLGGADQDVASTTLITISITTSITTFYPLSIMFGAIGIEIAKDDNLIIRTKMGPWRRLYRENVCTSAARATRAARVARAASAARATRAAEAARAARATRAARAASAARAARATRTTRATSAARAARAYKRPVS